MRFLPRYACFLTRNQIHPWSFQGYLVLLLLLRCIECRIQNRTSFGSWHGLPVCGISAGYVPRDQLIDPSIWELSGNPGMRIQRRIHPIDILKGIQLFQTSLE
jgi:hypothetical protein